MYDELKAMAHRQMAREPGGHTLQTTALVHEAFVKLVDSTQVGRRGRAYFFAAAARAMRQVLVEHARRHAAQKRGGGAVAVSLDSAQVEVDAFAVELLDLDRALEKLAERSAACARRRVQVLRRHERRRDRGSTRHLAAHSEVGLGGRPGLALRPVAPSRLILRRTSEGKTCSARETSC